MGYSFFILLHCFLLFCGVDLTDVWFSSFETSDAWLTESINNQPFQRVMYSSINVPKKDGDWAVTANGVNNELRLPQVPYYGGKIAVSFFAYTLQPTSLAVRFLKLNLELIQETAISINNNGWNQYSAVKFYYRDQVTSASLISILYSGSDSIYLDLVTIAIDGAIISCPIISSSNPCGFVTAVPGNFGWFFDKTSLSWILTPAFTYLKTDFVYWGGLLTGSINFRAFSVTNKVTIEISVNQTSFKQQLSSGFTNFDLTSATQYTVGQTYTLTLTFLTTNIKAIVSSISMNVAGNCSECHSALICGQYPNGVTCDCDQSSCPDPNTQCIVSAVDRSLNPCNCVPGYEKDTSGNCVDIDECALSTTNNCSVNAICNNFAGGYNCVCKSGYKTNDGGVESLTNQCQDIDECALLTTNICSNNAICNNFAGGYNCLCKSGYKTIDSGVESLINPCQDINECASSTTNICSINAICNNFVGGYNCVCKNGYKTNDGGVESLTNQCQDINECALSTTNICSINALCNNFAGGYNCICKSGYKTIDGGVESLINQCQDINECALSTTNICSINAICNNFAGGYNCVCKSGYKTIDGGVESLTNQCQDINECALSTTNICSINAICNNFAGGYNCLCKSGYKTNNGGVESFTNQCQDINECALSTTNNCSINAVCNNLVGGYNCTCKSGYKTINGGVESLINQCQDINECNLKPCSWSNGVCVNTNGSYFCSCKNSMKLGKDNVSCVSIAQACQMDNLIIDCKGKGYIKVVDANYEKTNACSDTSISKTKCSQKDQYNSFKDDRYNKCSDMKYCKILVPKCENYNSIKVQYYCAPKTNVVKICHGKELKIDCKNQELIEIVRANYKRTVGSDCPGFSDWRRECNRKRTNSIKVIRKMCLNKSSCIVKASNEVFGNLCVGTHKYLEVEYYCKG
ncbi:fibrillin-1-like isoform X2 [Hydra vulgaris]|uniref:Fibrillin-1-like isoform X2 n=1 Tax=Hydra vulgaris TaxID=6087 RepID=A0ABM4BXA2_HYDVU